MHIYISFGIRVLMDTYSLSIYSIIGEIVTSSPEIQSTRAFLHFVSFSSLLCVCFFHLVFASPPPIVFPLLNLFFGGIDQLTTNPYIFGSPRVQGDFIFYPQFSFIF